MAKGIAVPHAESQLDAKTPASVHHDTADVVEARRLVHGVRDSDASNSVARGAAGYDGWCMAPPGRAAYDSSDVTAVTATSSRGLPDGLTDVPGVHQALDRLNILDMRSLTIPSFTPPRASGRGSFFQARAPRCSG